MQAINGKLSEIEIGATRLRVISDCADDISTVVEAEKRVIEGFASQGLWPHTVVTLFVLESLAPLIAQLQQMHGLAARQTGQLPQRPMVNLYDLKHPQECFVFVNRHVLTAEKYWDDSIAIKGLLAHEHAHPISECPAIAAARTLSVIVAAPSALTPQLAQLAETLSVGAVSEIFANELCVAKGFATALAHLDQVTVSRAAKNTAQRPELLRRLKAAVEGGTMTAAEEGLFLLVADLQIALPFALETAPFFRAAHAASGSGIMDALHTFLLPHLEPNVAGIFLALHDLYLRPQSDWSSREIEPWCREVLLLLSASLSQQGRLVSFHLAGEAARTQETSSS